jgi:hypothetical protein
MKMIKVITILILITISPFESIADPTTSYLFNVEIETNDGETLNGFYSVTSYYLEINPNDSLNFFDHVLSVSTYRDSIILYPDTLKYSLEFVNNKTRETHYELVGKCSKISKNNIKSFKVLSWTSLLIGSVVSELKLVDKDWIADEYFLAEQIATNGVCDIYILLLKSNNDSLLPDLKELRKLYKLIEKSYLLSQEEQSKIWVKINYRTEELKKHKILVWRYCMS